MSDTLQKLLYGLNQPPAEPWSAASAALFGARPAIPPPTTALGALGGLRGAPVSIGQTLLGGLSPLLATSSGWIAVTRRFEQLHQNIWLTQPQVDDGVTKRAGVVSCLNRAYYGTSSETDNSFFVGSWGKNTMTRPPRDVDICFVLPYAVYQRFETNVGNRQSALLQEVKAKLLATFPATDMSGDGQVALVKFGSYAVEVVPAFALQQQGRYWICNANAGGSYKQTAPVEESNFIETTDANNARNLRPLIRMLKTWQRACGVPIKSFHLELLAAEFLAQSPWRLNTFFYFDWIIRDFFAYLYGKANGWVFAPGTMEAMSLGADWQSRAESAYGRAVKACDHEKHNRVVEAGDEWQKIFGTDIPRYA